MALAALGFCLWAMVGFHIELYYVAQKEFSSFPFVSKEQYEVYNVCNKVKNSTSCRKIGARLFFYQPDSSHSLVVSSIIEPETQHM